MRLSSLLLLSLLPLSVAHALPLTDTSNDDSNIADQTTLFLVKMIVLRSLMALNGHGKPSVKLRQPVAIFVLRH